MTLVMTLLVRDEADIVRDNLDFHLARGVDHVIATDNGSSDGTAEILEEYRKAGVLTLRHEGGQDHRQSEWVTAMALRARDEMGATWILSNDADEFWAPPGGDLKAFLVRHPERMLACRRYNMVAAPGALGKGPWWRVLVHRVRRPVPFKVPRDPLRAPLRHPYYYLALPGKVLLRGEGLVQVAQGNHSARFDPPVEPTSCEIPIYHFPIRSREEFQRGVVHIGKAMAMEDERPRSMAWQYRRWFAMLEADGNIDRAFAETLPGPARLAFDRLTGRVLRDTRLRDLMADMRTETAK